MADDDTKDSQRQAPVRSMSERELRLLNTAADFDGDELNLHEKYDQLFKQVQGDNALDNTLKAGTIGMNQLAQSVGVRGYSTDMDSTIFESRLAEKELAELPPYRDHPKNDPDGLARINPLSGQEYFNRKQALMQAEVDDPYATLVALADERVRRALGNDPDPELAARKRAEIWARWQASIDADIARGQTLEEAHRAMLYRLRHGNLLEAGRLLEVGDASKSVAQGPLSNTEYLNRKSQLATEAEALLGAELEAFVQERVSDVAGDKDAHIEQLRQSWADTIKRLMNKDGLSLEEAQRFVLHQQRTLHAIRTQAPSIDLFDVVRRMIEGEPLEHLETKAMVEKVMASVGEMDELIGMCSEHYPGNSPIREAVLKGTAGQQFVFGDQPSYGFAREQFTQDLHLPYKVSTFILPKIHKGSKLVVVAEQLRENQILLTAFHKTPEVDAAWYPLISRRRLHMNKGKLKVMEIGDGIHKLAGELYNRAINAVLGFLHSQANQTSVRLHKSFTPPEAGEINLLDGYSVVYMSGEIPIPNEPLGGTHASPREHDRRGHWRRTTSGRVWIEPMTINKGVGGRVEKIYRVSGHKTHQPDG